MGSSWRPPVVLSCSLINYYGIAFSLLFLSLDPFWRTKMILRGSCFFFIIRQWSFFGNHPIRPSLCELTIPGYLLNLRGCWLAALLTAAGADRGSGADAMLLWGLGLLLPHRSLRGNPTAIATGGRVERNLPLLGRQAGRTGGKWRMKLCNKIEKEG